MNEKAPQASQPGLTECIGFIGAGNMAEALARGLRQSGLPARQIAASDPDPARREVFRTLGGYVCAENTALVPKAGMLVLAVKPQIVPQVLAELAPVVPPATPVVSIAAGIETSLLRHFLPSCHIVRIMPNTPCLAGKGMTVLYAPESVPPAVRRKAEALVEVCGKTAWVPQEELLDAVTAVSGSGPAYFFLLCELLAEAARQVGLPPELSHLLSIQTCLGQAALLEKTGEEPSVLRRKVTSPGGTTEAALRVFCEGGLRGLMYKAIEAAACRAGELRESAWKRCKEQGGESSKG